MYGNREVTCEQLGTKTRHVIHHSSRRNQEKQLLSWRKNLMKCLRYKKNFCLLVLYIVSTTFIHCKSAIFIGVKETFNQGYAIFIFLLKD